MSSQSDSEDGADTNSDTDSCGSNGGHAQRKHDKDLIDTYFVEVGCSRWNITDFLENSSEPQYHRKMHIYRKSLECLEAEPKLEQQVRDRARKLLDHLVKGNRPDRKTAKAWEKRRHAKTIISSIHVTNSKICQSVIGAHSQVSTVPERGKKRRRGEISDASELGASIFKETNTPSISVADSAILQSVVGSHSHLSTTLGGRKRSKKSKRRKSLQEAPLNENCFARDYMEMKPARKWTLANEQGERGKGRIVEQILYDYYKEKEEESLAHSWIIELDEEVDPEIRSLFNDEEWQEICEEKPSDLLMADTCLAESMIRFSEVETPIDLRHVLETTRSRDPNHPYSRGEHYDCDWVDLVMRKILTLFEHPDQPLLQKSHKEGWFDCNIWSFIVDHCFQSLEGIVTERKELVSSATKLAMKGREIPITADQPADKSRRPLRHDALIFDPQSLYEFGASEAGPLFKGVDATKWLEDNHKLVKALHNMLSRLQRQLVKRDGEVLRDLQMVGILTSALHCQVIRVTYAKGYICLLSREPQQEVPTTANDLQNLLELLVGIWGAKKQVEKSAASFKNQSRCRTKEELYRKLRERPVAVTDRFTLPWSYYDQ